MEGKAFRQICELSFNSEFQIMKGPIKTKVDASDFTYRKSFLTQVMK